MRASALALCMTLVLASWLAEAKSSLGGSCSQADTHLDSGVLVTDCDATTYCAANGTCLARGCRSDEYPYGYNNVDFADLPPRCPAGQFCPDEGDQCLEQIPVGGQCQLDRDDECAPGPDAKDLSGYLNTNGSVCLNYQCYYANVTLGQACVDENMAYVSYSSNGGEYLVIVSRDNCANGLYCDGTALQCMKSKSIGTACTGNKECLTYNCSAQGKCLKATDTPNRPESWVYAIVAVSIFGMTGGVLLGLYFFHRKNRQENQIKLEQYYNEQMAYRQSIMSLSHAKHSLMSSSQNIPQDSSTQSLMTDSTYFGQNNHFVDRGMTASPPGSSQDLSGRDTWSDAGDSDAFLVTPSSVSRQGARPVY